MSNNITILYMTTKTEQTAEYIANIVLNARLAACVNIFPKGKSMYLWEGKIEQDNEYYMIFKTTEELVDELENMIISHHPYDVPAILKWNCTSNDEFYQYIVKTI